MFVPNDNYTVFHQKQVKSEKVIVHWLTTQVDLKLSFKPLYRKFEHFSKDYRQGISETRGSYGWSRGLEKERALYA